MNLELTEEQIDAVISLHKDEILRSIESLDSLILVYPDMDEAEKAYLSLAHSDEKFENLSAYHLKDVTNNRYLVGILTTPDEMIKVLNVVSPKGETIQDENLVETIKLARVRTAAKATIIHNKKGLDEDRHYGMNNMIMKDNGELKFRKRDEEIQF